MGKYSCTAKTGDNQAEAYAEICEDRIQISGGINAAVLYADISDMRLLNYTLILTLLKSDTSQKLFCRSSDSVCASPENKEAADRISDTDSHANVQAPGTDGADITKSEYAVEISKLGYETENFFENLWEAYAKKSREALFVAEAPLIDTEGDYFFEEVMNKADFLSAASGKEALSLPEDTYLLKKGIAKLSLCSDCVCLFPHNIYGRRIPLCFSTEPIRDGFEISLSLDTGERYGFSRLGFNTDHFFERLIKFRGETVKKWRVAHELLERDLDKRIGSKDASLKAFRESGANVVSGLFAPNDEEQFWIAAVNDGRAAVELITEEDTALYIYSFDIPKNTFILRLRHAMEAVKKNRRLIYIPEEALMAEPLYRISVYRSPHVRFLRGCCEGRIIHTGAWEDKVKEYLAGSR